MNRGALAIGGVAFQTVFGALVGALAAGPGRRGRGAAIAGAANFALGTVGAVGAALLEDVNPALTEPASTKQMRQRAWVAYFRGIGDGMGGSGAVVWYAKADAVALGDVPAGWPPESEPKKLATP